MPFSSVLGASSVIKPGVCTSTTRPAVPYTGQLIFETDTGSVASWNGSAWVYTHSSGLVLVKSQTIGSAVSSVTVSDVFSATYDAYKIIVSGGVLASTGNIGLKFGATATGYYFGASRVQYGAGASVFTQANGTSFLRVGNGNTAGLNACIEVINPFLTANTIITGGFADLSTSNESYNYAGYVNNSTSYTAFDLTFAANATGGTIRVYGYKN